MTKGANMAEQEEEPNLDEMVPSTQTEEFLTSLLSALNISTEQICHIDEQGCIWQEIDGTCVRTFCPPAG